MEIGYCDWRNGEKGGVLFVNLWEKKGGDWLGVDVDGHVGAFYWLGVRDGIGRGESTEGENRRHAADEKLVVGL